MCWTQRLKSDSNAYVRGIDSAHAASPSKAFFTKIETDFFFQDPKADPPLNSFITWPHLLHLHGTGCTSSPRFSRVCTIYAPLEPRSAGKTIGLGIAIFAVLIIQGLARTLDGTRAAPSPEHVTNMSTFAL